MTFVDLANLVSHLQNASRGRLGLTSCKSNKFNLALLLALQRTGYLSFVARGGALPPDPAHLSTYKPEPLSTANVAKQRLWVGLKYSNNRPVMGGLKVISTPTRTVKMALPDLERVARGFDAGDRMMQKGLNMGESMFLSTSKGVMEVREAVERKMGGVMLFRVEP